MLSYLKKILIPEPDSSGRTFGGISKDQADKKVQLVTCILFVEIANADEQFSPEEAEKIISIMEQTFNLDKEDIKELIELALQRMKIDDSIYDYTTIINRNFSNDEKYGLLKNLWRLVFVDRSMDKYEEHLVKKIGLLINVDYRDIISSKLLVKKELKI